MGIVMDIKTDTTEEEGGKDKNEGSNKGDKAYNHKSKLINLFNNLI